MLFSDEVDERGGTISDSDSMSDESSVSLVEVERQAKRGAASAD